MYLLNLLVSYTCKIILWSIGWHLDDLGVKYIVDNKRNVLTFSHTSYFDFMLMLLYRGAYTTANLNMYVAVNSHSYNMSLGLLSMIGAISVTKNTVISVVTKLKNKDTFNFLISPEGSLSKKEWKSGYYHIAKNLNCHVIPIGFDYEKKTLVVGPVEHASHYENRKDLEYKLKETLSSVVPLYPNNTTSDVRKHNEHKIGVIDPIVFTNVIAMLIPTYTLYFYDTKFLLLSIVNNAFSLVYHHSYERNKIAARFDKCLTITSALYFYSFIFVPDVLGILLTSLIVVTYYFGSGRHAHSYTHSRSDDYLSYHSIFHIAIGVLVSYSTWPA